MDNNRTAEVTRGVVLPLILLVVILALGVVTGQDAVYIALMATVPVLSAVFTGPRLTAIVAFVSVVAAAALLVIPSDAPLSDSYVPMGAVIVFAVIAVVASQTNKVVIEHVEAPVERRKSAQFQLQTQADLDSMTGLLNRRGAIRTLGPRNAGGERVVAFLDCDLFKSVNEQYGSDVGDEFLQAIAGRLRHRLPAHDTVARWDGDEFLVVISAESRAARPALERLVKGINGTTIRTTAGPIPATVSVGAAPWSPGQDLENVISRAGKALYAAKSGGRGAIVLDGESAGAADAAASTAPAADASD